MLNRIPLMFSSHMTPSLVAHWKAASMESLISLRNWTPLAVSTSMLGPLVLGPKHQIFWESVLSHSNWSTRIFDLSLDSTLGPTSSFSIMSERSSLKGLALTKSLLCLLGDLERHIWLDSSVTVSLYWTTGSPTLISHLAYSSTRSLRQISTWSSPHPAMMCSPDSVVWQTTRGSDLESFLSPSTSLGRSAAFLTSTETLTTGDTEYFMTLMLWAVSSEAMVPCLRRYWSTPTSPTVLPQGTSGTASTFPAIMMTVLWMFLTLRSFLDPGV
mmetsp:Transcript_17689/g.29905  ORF Transcript_17689/g.29905 Transcript_17689/m.29905 type:complete len:271 (+) Transcript_17689:531-1343(+)